MYSTWASTPLVITELRKKKTQTEIILISFRLNRKVLLNETKKKLGETFFTVTA